MCKLLEVLCIEVQDLEVGKYGNIETWKFALLLYYNFIYFCFFFVHSQSFSRLKCRCGPGSPLFPLVCK